MQRFQPAFFKWFQGKGFRKIGFCREQTASRVILLVTLLVGCSTDNTGAEEKAEPIRGLKAYRVTQTAGYELRRFPSVVSPSEESELSFEISGQLKAINLEIGQKVIKGDLIAEIDPVSLEFQVKQSKASVAQAQASLDQARSDYERRASLLPKGYITQAEYDIAKSTLDSAAAQLSQAQQQLSINEENLHKSRLLSPFDGTLSNIYVENFEQITAGKPVASLYSETGYEVSISVPPNVIDDLTVGGGAEIRFPDLSEQYHRGVITELGTRAEQVSSFPVVVAIMDAPAGLYAGMAADVEVKVSLHRGGEGYLIPLSCLDFAFYDSFKSETDSKRQQQQAIVYVYNPETSTVHARPIVVTGVLGNRVIVSEGLEEGLIIASAGVSYLYEGQQVKLLPLN